MSLPRKGCLFDKMIAPIPHHPPQPADSRAAFRYPNFRLYQASRFLGVVAIEMQSVAIGWQIYELTRRPLDLGLVGLAQFLPGILLFLALSSPVLTRLTPELLKATANSQPGVVIHVPPPTARDSYVQFMGNLGQLVIIAVIIAGAATISAERRAGTAVLVLTKPLSRPALWSPRRSRSSSCWSAPRSSV